MSRTTMPLFEVQKDSTGVVLVVTLWDPDTLAELADVDTASSVLFWSRTDDGTQVRGGATAGFYTDGTDSKVQFQLDATDVGTAQRLVCQFQLVGYEGGGDLFTEPFVLDVREGAKI